MRIDQIYLCEGLSRRRGERKHEVFLEVPRGIQRTWDARADGENEELDKFLSWRGSFLAALFQLVTKMSPVIDVDKSTNKRCIAEIFAHN
ncbi:unnamed protein product [Dovyalis caffra]|uniref:Uncharacterized protein n=1 Tax=Dovyalis caffra TaxID=77055 RepID=A0AAV1STS4_9ROSI|nr:unnamed protein product [Dovyalis caffra]